MSETKMGRPNELPHLWSELALAVGSVEKLAAALGVTTKTVQRTAKKDAADVKKALQIAVNLIAKAHKVKSPFDNVAYFPTKKTGT